MVKFKVGTITESEPYIHVAHNNTVDAYKKIRVNYLKQLQLQHMGPAWYGRIRLLTFQESIKKLGGMYDG